MPCNPQNIIQIICHCNCAHSPGTFKFYLHYRENCRRQLLMFLKALTEQQQERKTTLLAFDVRLLFFRLRVF